MKLKLTVLMALFALTLSMILNPSVFARGKQNSSWWVSLTPSFVQSLRWVAKGADATDAVQGGEEDGHPLYVCRASYASGIHPGKVVAGKCNIGYGGKEIVLANYEILVGSGAWGEPRANYRGAFVAGTEDGKSVYLCRTAFAGGVHPGKVVAGNCNIGYGGKEKVMPKYEVFYRG